jgi:hypothetical protein
MRAFVSRDGSAAEMPLAEAVNLHIGTSFVWIHLDGVDPLAIDWINGQDAIPHVIKSALTAAETRPRCDVIGEGALLNLRGVGQDLGQCQSLHFSGLSLPNVGRKGHHPIFERRNPGPG